MMQNRKEILLTAAIYLQKLATAAADVLWLILLAELIGEAVPADGVTAAGHHGNAGRAAQYVLGLILLSAWKRMGYSLGRILTMKLQNMVRFRLNCKMVEKTAKIPYRLLEDYAFCELRQALKEHIDGSFYGSFVWFTVQKSANFMMFCIRTAGLCLLLGRASLPLGGLFFLLQICQCLMQALKTEQDAAFAETGQSSPEKQYMEELALGQGGAGERSLFAYVGYTGEKCDREAAAARKRIYACSLEWEKAGLAIWVLIAITFVLTELALSALMTGGRISQGYFIALSIGAFSLLQKNEEGDAIYYLYWEKLFLKQWNRFLNLPETETEGEGAGGEDENSDGGERDRKAGSRARDKKAGSRARDRKADSRERDRKAGSGERDRKKREKTETGDIRKAGSKTGDNAGDTDKEGKRKEWKYGKECTEQKEFETLEFKNVSFRYPRTGRYVLRDLNFKMTKGGYYAFVGENGSGKTTIVKLLSGMYDNYEGEIRLNGIELRDIPFCERRRIFAVLFQDAARYEDTIVQNIFPPESREVIAGEPDRGNRVVILRARQLAEELVREWEADGGGRFPRGADTFLGSLEENGVILSEGEWQQLLIARELARSAQIRVLDEPMASLDIFRQSKVCEQFTQEDGNHTTLLFSHHMAVVRKAKRIFVLRDGAIAEEGSHQQLMTEKGLYARMYEIQCISPKPPG